MKISAAIFNQITYFLLLFICISVISCHGQNNTHIDDNIRSIFQDQHGNYWFGTNAAGVYRYDGKRLLQFTEMDGLANNQVQSIREDKAGNMWFGTGLFGVSRYDGQKFSSFTKKDPVSICNISGNEKSMESDDLWFCAGGGVFRYHNNSLSYLPLMQAIPDSLKIKQSAYTLGPYAAYCVLQDRTGNLWIGTQAMGVCCFDGKTFAWYTEKGLKGPAVLALFEDSHGNLWFGNNGSGLFRYDGKTLRNVTEENGLRNTEFSISATPGPNTLARVYSINEDKDGRLWIGSVDDGLWRYDGHRFTHYATADGLTSNAINTIFKDKNNELWFGTDQDGIYRLEEAKFVRFEVK